MKKGHKSSSAKSIPVSIGEKSKYWKLKIDDDDDINQFVAKRSSNVVLAMFVLALSGAWALYHYQFQILPTPVTLEQAGAGGFSEHEAIKHVKELTKFGPHPVGSDALIPALQYVWNVSEAIKKNAGFNVDVEVDFFNAKPGSHRPAGDRFKGKTLVYSDLHHVVLRISPKGASEAREDVSEARKDVSEAVTDAILVSAHVDTVFSAEGAGDDTSNVAVMLELARGISQGGHGLKNSVIFLFNTAEEEGLDGSNSFITQFGQTRMQGILNGNPWHENLPWKEMNPWHKHPWKDTLRVAINLEAMGIGGKSGIFQAGPQPWAIETFATAAKYPSGQIVAQDIFSSGVIKSSTDFQVYRDVGGLSGLDFAFADNTAVYHTKNDKLALLKPGSLQHLGENLLPFLLQAANSDDLPGVKITESYHDSPVETAVYFDILGTWMIVFRQSFAKTIYKSVIVQSVLIWAASFVMGGFLAVISFFLSCLTLIFMWIGSITFASLVAFILPSISSSPVPFVATPWLLLGLYGSPALLGALIGQHLGYLLLRSYLSSTYSVRKCDLSSALQVAIAEWDSERCIFKAGLLQWLLLLILGNYYNVGSSYLALVWLVSPAFAYFLLEGTLSPVRLPRPLKTLTLLIGLFLPFLLTSGSVIQLTGTLVGNAVRFDSNPGSIPEWRLHIVLAIFIAAIVCLTLVYHLSYVHTSGAKGAISFTALIVFGLSVSAALFGLVPAFTEDTARAVNVLHVVDARGTTAAEHGPQSFISLFSTTPGNLNKEAEQIGGLVCGKDKQIDFVTFQVSYSCWSEKDVSTDWAESDIPEFLVVRDIFKKGRRITYVSMDTKISTRWSLGINTEEIEDFQLKDESQKLVSGSENSSIDGWHIIQFAGWKNSTTKFNLRLFWVENYDGTKKEPLLKLRTDVDKLTPAAADVLARLPAWCSQYGKSSSPKTLSFFSSLPVDFKASKH